MQINPKYELGKTFYEVRRHYDITVLSTEKIDKQIITISNDEEEPVISYQIGNYKLNEETIAKKINEREYFENIEDAFNKFRELLNLKGK